MVYLRGQEGRGIGLGHKIRAYALQEVGLDTVDANTAHGLPVDSRSYGVGAPSCLKSAPQFLPSARLVPLSRAF